MKGRRFMAIKEFLGLRVIGILGTGPPPALPDLVSRPLQYRFVGGVLPQHQILNDFEGPLSLILLGLLCLEQVRIARRGILYGIAPAIIIVTFFPKAIRFDHLLALVRISATTPGRSQYPMIWANHRMIIG
jgi:hypothetical protein